jgi:Fic/DOC family
MEGNSLTLRETKVVLEGITIGGKRLHDHLEAINHRDAILRLEELVQKAEPLSEWQIKCLHQIILRGIDDARASLYRAVNIRISGAEHTPPEALLVPQQMEAFIHGHQSRAPHLHLELLKAGWPPVILPVESRLAYYETLDAHHVHGDFEPFLHLITGLVAASFEPYWFALGETGAQP